MIIIIFISGFSIFQKIEYNMNSNFNI